MRKIKFFIFNLILLGLWSCKSPQTEEIVVPDTIYTNKEAMGPEVQVIFTQGKFHNHPLMAIWVETIDGEYIETLYVARSIAKGTFNYGDKTSGHWMPGEIRRPAALPFWSHKRNVVEADSLFVPTSKTPMPDAVTSATPKQNFILISHLEKADLVNFRILFEINQTWDWNEYWTNNKYPEDSEYKTSCQPAVVYAADIDLNSGIEEYELKPIGHSHYSGKTGELFTTLNTLTTALEITKKITVKVKK